MKFLVIYQSKTGFTKKYAQWIAEELSADICEHNRVHQELFNHYDVIIYGGSLHAVGVIGVGLITKNIDILKNKKFIVFAVGASPHRQEIVNEIRDKNFSKEEQQHIQFFYLRGGFDYDKLPFLDKMLMKLLQFKLKRKKVLSADEKGMLNAYRNPVDFTCREQIADIIAYAHSVRMN